MKTVLFISYDGLPYNRLRCHLFSKTLGDFGIKSSVFSFRDNLGAKHHGPDSYKTDNLHRIILVLKAIIFLFKQPKKVDFIVQKAGFHILAPVLVSYIKGNKLILDYDDYEYYENSKLRNIFFILILKRAKCIVAASKFLAKFLESKTSKKVYYIPGGTDTNEFSPKKVKKEKLYTFSWVGNINDEEVLKNLIFLLECFDQVYKKNSKTLLHLRASGDRIKSVEEEIKQKGYKNVKIISWVDDLPKYLSSVHCGLFPLVNMTKYNAAKCPGKLFEYMACGLPTICTGFGEATHILDSKSGIFAKNKKEFIEHMVSISKDPKKYSSLGKSARKRVVKFFDSKILMSEYAKIIKT